MIYAIASLKGGVGKTSLAIFLSQAFSQAGKVLVVDLDPNNNTTDFFLRDSDPEQIEDRNAYHALTGQESLGDCIHPLELGISVLPCTPDLHRVGQELGTKPAAVIRFRANLKKSGFDFVVIDTPPSLGYELRAGLFVAEKIVTPFQPSRWTFQNLEILKNEIEDAQEASDIKKHLYVVPSIVTETEAERLKAQRISGMTKTHITKSASVRLAGIKGRPLKDKTKSRAQFIELAKELQK